MPDRVIILGARGRFGRAALHAFHEAGWQVAALGRSWDGLTLPQDVRTVTADATDAAALARAAAGFDVIVNALNPPYHRWKTEVPKLTASVIAAAKATGATVIVPGNIYNYGEDMPAVLAETTPHRPTVRKGRIRETMERAYEAAAAEGVRTIVLRAGDFLEREKSGNWFDSYIANRAGEGKVTYPGPRDRTHAWAYLPDLGRATAALAAKRAAFAPFETFGFAGYGLTGDQLVAAIERATGRTMKVASLPQVFLRLAGLVNPMAREVVEVMYLWRVPHAIDDAKLKAALPDFAATPLDVAMADCLGIDQPTPQLELVRAA